MKMSTENLLQRASQDPSVLNSVGLVAFRSGDRLATPWKLCGPLHVKRQWKMRKAVPRVGQALGLPTKFRDGVQESIGGDRKAI